MNFDHKPVCVLVTGKKGSGKTTYWLRRLVMHPARWKFIFDPTREVSRKLGLPVCLSVQDMVQRTADSEMVCFDSSALCPGDRRAGFAFFTRWVFNVSKTLKGVKLLACDEFQSVQRTGDSGLPPGIKEITDEGRREEIDCLFAVQRLNEVNDDVRGQLTELVTFKHNDPLAVDWLRRAVNGMGCDFDEAKLTSLPTPGGYLHFTDTGQVKRGGKSFETDPKRKADRVAGHRG